MIIMYLLATDQIVKAYPYSIEDLKRDNPNTSYPNKFSDELLADWNVYPVIDKPTPDYNPVTQNCNQVNPTLVDGQWVITWVVTLATPEEIERRTKAKESEVRQQRNALLSVCDWTQLPDAPVDHAVWAAYRQALRDVTSQPGFPWEVVWPEQP